MDKTWRSLYRATDEYEAGVDEFIEFASKHAEDEEILRCPCNQCKNLEHFDKDTVKFHLMSKGIDMTYDPFILHGEEAQVPVEDDYFKNTNTNHAETYELFKATNESNSKEILDGAKEAKLQKVIEEAEKPLYGGSKYTKLDAVVSLYTLKAKRGWSNSSFTELLEILEDILPEDNIIPRSHHSARPMLRKFDLDFKQVHACVNDCMLFWDKYEDLVTCPKCKASRWKVDPHTEKVLEKVPAKVLRYFPVIPRFKRMFRSVDTAKDLTWHASNRSSDGIMRHPADSPAWKHIDNSWPSFGEDARNLRLGLSADGVNPHRTLSSRYSCWPVILAIYNLPPWLCMRRKYLMLTLIIPGPNQPGKDIDIYLQPLISDLLVLWRDGVQTYDACTKTTFTLRSILMWTINDFPALGNLAGCATKGRVGCPKCGVNTRAEWLKYSRKFSYMGSRRFLPDDHPFRFKKSWFNGKQELDPKPIPLKGTEIFEEVDIIEADWGKPCKNVLREDWGKAIRPKKRKRGIGMQMKAGLGIATKLCKQKSREGKMWKKRSIFFNLPYWRHLLIRHNLDVMHIEKNICESLLGTLLNMKKRSKDGVKSRQDLEELGIRADLHPKRDGDRTLLPAAPYTLSKNEKQIFCERLKSLKLPDGYSSNISYRVSLDDHTIYDLKSHDYHVLMQQLLPVALRNLLPKGPRNTIFRLCSFYNELCQKTIDRERMESLEDEVVQTMCLLERYFPPSFFDIMVHLTIHLVQEACLGGPVQFRWMYGFERYMKDLKASVRNHARPEGCMAECHLADECVRFCAENMKNVKCNSEQVSRNEDYDENPIIAEGKPLLKATPITLTESMLEAAHLCLLFNFKEVQPYIEEHKKELIRKDSRLGKNEGALTAKHTEKFSEWFKTEIENEKKHKPVSKVLDWLADGPSIDALSYKGYLIKGHRYHTKDGEKGTQNSGVSLSASTLCRASAKDIRQVEETVTYYGVIRQIILLDYGTFKYPVFKCDWANAGSGIKVEEGFTLVNLHQSLYHKQDPFILASQAEPVFYSRESSDSSWYVVLRAPPRGFHDFECSADEDLGNVSTPPSPFENVELVNDIEDDGGVQAYERKDCPGTWYRKKKKP